MQFEESLLIAQSELNFWPAAGESKMLGPGSAHQRSRNIECLLDPLAHALGQAGFVALSRPGAVGKVTQAP